MSTPTVLIVSTSLDESTDVVVRRLEGRGTAVVRLDTEAFPFGRELSTRLSGQLTLDWNLPSPMTAVNSVWYRRLRAPERPEGMNPGVYDFCVREARSALIGMLLATRARFMSPPPAVWAAENKIFQLETARRIGLPIPRTIVTNSPAEIRSAFSEFRGRMIIKPAKSGFVDYGSEQHAIYTNRFLEEHLERVDTARLCPAIYQEHLEKDCDVRVTIVGRQLFVAEIDSQSDPAAKVDWRHTSNPDLPHRRGNVPPEIAAGILQLMDSLGLSFGAIDLVRAPDGTYTFLEVNPSGQWLWLEDQLGFEISHAVADWLSAVPG